MAGRGSALREIDARDRLDFLRSTLKLEAERAQVWQWSWITIGAALAAGNFVRAGLATSGDDRVDPLVSGTTSLLIPALLLLKPPRVIHDAAALDRPVLPAGDASDPCLALASAESVLSESADDESLGSGPLAQAIVFGGNTAIGSLLGLGYGHWSSGMITAVGGIFLGEIQIATQPTGAIVAREAYLRGELVPPRRASLLWRAVPLITADVRGAVIEITL